MFISLMFIFKLFVLEATLEIASFGFNPHFHTDLRRFASRARGLFKEGFWGLGALGGFGDVGGFGSSWGFGVLGFGLWAW